MCIVYYSLCIGYLVCFQFLAVVYVQEFRVYGYLDEILSGYVRLFKKYILAWSYFDYILRCLLKCFVSICPMKLSVSHWGQRPIVLIFYSPLLNTLPGKQEAFVFLNEFKGFLRSRKLIPSPTKVIPFILLLVLLLLLLLLSLFSRVRLCATP